MLPRDRSRTLRARDRSRGKNRGFPGPVWSTFVLRHLNVIFHIATPLLKWGFPEIRISPPAPKTPDDRRFALPIRRTLRVVSNHLSAHSRGPIPSRSRSRSRSAPSPAVISCRPTSRSTHTSGIGQAGWPASPLPHRRSADLECAGAHGCGCGGSGGWRGVGVGVGTGPQRGASRLDPEPGEPSDESMRNAGHAPAAPQ
jgi:hypothetical protein